MSGRLAMLAAALAALAALACGAAGLLAPPVAAATYYPPWEQGLPGHPFNLLQPVSPAVVVLGTGDQQLQLARATLTDLDPSAPMWSFWSGNTRPDPRMACPLPNGDVLVSGGKDVTQPYVMEVDKTGTVVWQYRNGADGLLRKPFSAEPATFGGRSCILISDRIACRVFAVDKQTKQVGWQYGTTDVPGQGVNQLADPFCASQIAPTAGQKDGDVLIADSNDNHRVIEVRSDDYDPSAPDFGYTARSIVWQYGITGQGGTAPGYLDQARSPQRLADGDTLITDAASQRIICVRTADYDPSQPNDGYTADSIVWSYHNGADGTLDDPNSARLVTSGALSGDVLVTDAKAQTVEAISFDDAKRTVWSLSLATYQRPSYVGVTDAASPRDARVGPDGSVWIADAGFGRILQLGNEGTGAVTSAVIHSPDVVKAFTSIRLEACARPAGTSFAVWYSLDGAAFRPATISADGRTIDFPAGTSGTRFQYRVVLTSSDRWTTPTFGGMAIHFMRASSGGSGGGGGGTAPGGSGNSGGSGEYTYPGVAAVGGTGATGSGTGSGTAGYGTGAGFAGAGVGSAGSGTGPAAVSVQVPVQSAGSGPAQPVQGYRVQGEQGVSGVPLQAAPGAQAPAQTPGRYAPPVPALALVGAGAFVALAFFLPWPFMAAGLRRLTGFEHTRAARPVPFRPLKR